ncbi:16S rRNA (uracil(1498)-N(3))-methyltransferase [Sporomusa sphaeroides]|uniref:Ribosomal RNA small subunit methyltransferase E n=1 Tax=Sporomusa sphaeroides DSM 2875 TaxID=1337886 RepID=A0ABP2C201_9FIRM|nr:16S rRNA (uracil(1498)-N(3))-methyltransferase [Sporomusa sphaeroides]OLS58365.1 ribosomal RNA small subunit methyltransferase E [Sporomusa sphaeroides DSM 2875]CVK17448.1 Ribosomal RNA small subunit methyltransferase E [Sporomusa sphaeroides DSM 2875]
MRRFFIEAPISQTMAITGPDARHMAAVLRLAAGDTVLLSGQDGKTCQAQITQATPEVIQLTLLSFTEDNTEPSVAVYLVQGLTKGEKMDFIVQKAVELGVHGIIPAATEHCVVRYEAAKQADKVNRWQKIAREAAKQCGRSHIPQVYPIIRLADVLTNQEFTDTNKIMLYEGQAACGLKQVLVQANKPAYMLFIGPEGGFSTAEVGLCQKQGVSIVTMGPRIMRTETAALAALTAVMYECGDLGG